MLRTYVQVDLLSLAPDGPLAVVVRQSLLQAKALSVYQDQEKERDTEGFAWRFDGAVKTRSSIYRQNALILGAMWWHSRQQ